MASKLVGLKKALVWKDFGTPRKGAPPKAGETKPAAKTWATYRFKAGGERVEGTKKVRLKDDVEVKIYLDSKQTWVMNWTLKRPVAVRNDILHHEQGHYDLVALFCRDMFIELMALKEKTFDSGSELNTAIQEILQRFNGPIADVHDVYDTATKHGLLAAGQKKWDGYIETAFTKERTPQVKAPDGAAYKVPLLEVLESNGVQL